VQKGKFLLQKGKFLLHSGEILPRQPTHLHSHFLLLDFYFLMEQAKAKESASNRTKTMDRHDTTEKKQRTANRRLAKKRVQCLNEVLCFVSSSVLAASLVLRNPLLRQALNRCQQWRGFVDSDD